jgi:hypothetical protein
MEKTKMKPPGAKPADNSSEPAIKELPRTIKPVPIVMTMAPIVLPMRSAGITITFGSKNSRTICKIICQAQTVAAIAKPVLIFFWPDSVIAQVSWPCQPLPRRLQ